MGFIFLSSLALKNMGHTWECNTWKQADVSKITGYTSPHFWVRRAPDLSPGADSSRSTEEANLLFLSLVHVARVMRATNAETRSRRSWSILGLNSGSSQQIFIKYTQKAGHYRQNQSINQYEDFSLCGGKGQYMHGWRIQV